MSDSNIFTGLPEKKPEPKPLLPEQLKGKTSEEVYTLLQQEHMREMETQETKLKLEAAEAQKVQQPQKVPPKFVPPVVPPMQQTQQTSEDLFNNPDKFMDSQFQKRMSPVINAFAGSQRSTNREVFKGKLPEGEWGKYSEEIDKFVDGLAPRLQMEGKAYEAAYNFVRGAHTDEIVEEKSQQLVDKAVKKALTNLGISEEKIQEAVTNEKPAPVQQVATSLFQPITGVIPSVVKGKSASPAARKKPRLTDEQRAAMEKFNMTEEDYIAYGALNTDIISEMNRREG